MGGLAGNNLFIQTGNDESNSPEFHARNGSRGSNGTDATPCENTALRIRVDTYRSREVPVFWTHYHAALKLYSRFVNPRCSIEYTSAAIKNREPIEPLKFKSELVEYKSFLRENMKIASQAKNIRKAYNAIDFNRDLSSSFNVADLVIEVNALESQFYELNEFVDLLPFYENLLKRLDDYSTLNEENISMSDRKVLALIYTTLLSKTLGMRSSHNTDFIIDIENFFELIMLEIKELDETVRIKLINQQRDRYNGDIMAKINETDDFIENDVQPEIEKLFATLDSEMQNVIDEINEWQGNTAAEIEWNQKNVKIIRRNVGVRMVTGLFAMVSKSIPYLGVVAGGIDAIANKFLIDPDIKKINVPTWVRKVQNDLHEVSEKRNRQKIDAIEKELHKLNVFLQTLEQTENLEIADKLNCLMSKVKTVESKHPISRADVEQRFREFSDLVNEQRKKLVAIDGTAQIIQQLQKTANALAVIASSSSMYGKFSTDSNKLDAIGKAINEDWDSLAALIAFKDSIYAEMLPMINALHENLGAIETNLGAKSSAALDVQKWKVRDTLHSVKGKLVESISGLKNEKAVQNCLVKIDEAMNVMIQLYDRIQIYLEQTKLAVYMSDLHSADFRKWPVADKQLRHNLNQLQFNFQANIILSQYIRAEVGFKQAVFPFAADYLDIYRLPANFGVEKNIDTVVASAVVKIESLSKRLKEFNTTVINENDASIHIADFDRSCDAPGPFYVWQNDVVRDKIQELFAGKKVYLLADVVRSRKLNAVKFNVINLAFRSSNQTINEQLEKALQSFHVSLTHMGESNYRCNDQFYTISSRPQKISYSFAMKNQVPAVRNVVYDKLSGGVKLLSPYTLWAIELWHGQFDELKPFVNFVDIELHGHGQYVDEGARICDTDLDEFYSPLPLMPRTAALQQHFTRMALNAPTHSYSKAGSVALILALVALVSTKIFYYVRSKAFFSLYSKYFSRDFPWKNRN